MKPIVYYHPDQPTRYQLNARASVWIDAHHNPNVAGFGPVTTSPVIRIGTHGEFETLNTIYKPTNPLVGL